MNPIARLRAELQSLETQGLLRVRRAARPGEGLLHICSNDYLGYGRGPVSRETMLSIGSGASRLIGGTHAPHEALEREVADWVGLSDALLFSSGYAANVGVLAALAGPECVVISDELNHASIIDGCRLGRARVEVVPHCDVAAVERVLRGASRDETAWVVTESYFSMDADSPDLRSLRALCDEADAGLYVDEAHALGVFGPEGGGLCRETGIRPDVVMGTLGKAVGVQGAFVAGAPEVMDFLWNRARSFVFSTAPSPTVAVQSLANVKRARSDDTGRARLEELSARLQQALGDHLAPGRHGPVFPIVLGTPERAVRAAEALRSKGFFAVAIRPPTVPAGASRIRVSLRADLSDSDFARLTEALEECLES